MTHFALKYAKHVNEVLHNFLWETWFYKHEIYVIPDILTALLITYDYQRNDECEINNRIEWNDFIKRMSRIKQDWEYFSIETMKKVADDRPQMTMCGWEGRTFYFIKGGIHPEYWTVEHAQEDIIKLLTTGAKTYNERIGYEIENVKKFIPYGKEHYRDYEQFLKVIINYLFIGDLGEATPQIRTDPDNEGLEIRDLICQNRAEKGFWKDLKDKYFCIEILFEAKNTAELKRDNLRQVYCYLKPAIGFWGFIVCRERQKEEVYAYNRTLFKNFEQKRGILILSDDDINSMVTMKQRGKNPSEYLRDRMSDFLRSI